MAIRQHRRFSPSPRWSLEERIAFATMPEPNSGCLLWLGNATRAGYPLIGFGGKLQYAHRLCWEMRNGPIPRGMMICHRCDVPGCVNLGHLFLGTCAENAADMIAKGRSPRGERAGNAKLTDGEVRRLLVDQRSYAAIAREFGVGVGHVKNIKAGGKWAHVTGPRFRPRKVEGERHGMAILTEVDVRRIRADGRQNIKIAADLGVHRTTVRDIKNGRSWRSVL